MSSSPRRPPAARRSATTSPCSSGCSPSRGPGRCTCFPTKALAHDQLAELNALPRAVPLDRGARLLRRRHARPRSAPKFATARASSCRTPTCCTWASCPSIRAGPRSSRRSRVVVIDEMHVYRGVFGSHVANVLRRLRRICALLRRHAAVHPRLGHDRQPGRTRRAADRGPGHARRTGEGRRAAGREADHLLQPAHRRPRPWHSAQHRAGIRRARRALPRARRADDRLRPRPAGDGADADPPARRAAASAAQGCPWLPWWLPGGGPPRRSSKGCARRQCPAVVATNALELGIDIGDLDAAILAGHPGTIASARQQMGRAGRRQGLSVAVLVAGAGPLDQYIITHPRWLLQRSPEHARINPDNEILLSAHLACAAARAAVARRRGVWRRIDGQPERQDRRLLADLVEAGQLYLSGGRYFWAGEGNPAQALSLRSAGSDRVVIQARGEDGKPVVIGELDREAVPLLLYKGAVYLHEGVSYVVETLDWEAGLASRARDRSRLLHSPGDRREDRCSATHARIAEESRRTYSAGATSRVTSQATGYKILHRGTGRGARLRRGGLARADARHAGLLAGLPRAHRRGAEGGRRVAVRPERLRPAVAGNARRGAPARRLPLPGVRHARDGGPPARRSPQDSLPRVRCRRARAARVCPRRWPGRSPTGWRIW